MYLPTRLSLGRTGGHCFVKEHLLDETVNTTIKHSSRVTFRVVRAMVLYELVRVQHVRPDLIAESVVPEILRSCMPGLSFSVKFSLVKLRSQHSQRFSLVSML